MYVIEVDGVEIQPYPIDILTSAVAQRYSVLVQAKNETNTNYAMSVIQSEDMYDAIPDDLVLNNTVTISYASSNPAPQKVFFDEMPVLNDTEFVPVLKKEMAPADIEFRLDVFFDVSKLQRSCPGKLTKSRRTMMAPTGLRTTTCK